MSESSRNSKMPPMNFTLPVGYCVKGVSVPGNLTLEERKVFIQGLGVPENHASLFAMQDRSASLISNLMAAIERTGNAPALEFANKQVQKWNDECNALLLRG